MSTIKKLEDLETWQEAKKLSIGIYIITKTFPQSEKYNITKHLRESGRGTMGNVAEGFGRYYYRESIQFYNIALGCLNEVKSDIILSYHLDYIKINLLNRFLKQIEKVSRKINGMINHTLTKTKPRKKAKLNKNP